MFLASAGSSSLSSPFGNHPSELNSFTHCGGVFSEKKKIRALFLDQPSVPWPPIDRKPASRAALELRLHRTD